MKLILNEMVYHYYDRDVAESVKSIIYETSGLHNIRDGVMWFDKSGLKRIKIEPDEQLSSNAFAWRVRQVLKNAKLQDRLFVVEKFGQVFLMRMGDRRDG